MVSIHLKNRGIKIKSFLNRETYNIFARQVGSNFRNICFGVNKNINKPLNTPPIEHISSIPNSLERQRIFA